MAAAFDDFCLARTHPDAFEFRSMPPDWQRAQRVLAVEYERLRFQLMLQLLKKGVM